MTSHPIIVDDIIKKVDIIKQKLNMARTGNGSSPLKSRVEVHLGEAMVQRSGEFAWGELDAPSVCGQHTGLGRKHALVCVGVRHAGF